MAHGWSVGSARLEFRAAFPAGKLVVLDALGGVSAETKLAQKGSWPVVVMGQTFTLTRVAGFLGPKTELKNASGVVVPPSTKRVSAMPAPTGSVCAQHGDSSASGACARCGTFFCQQCVGADLLHCGKCAQAQSEQAQRDAAAARWMVPGVAFVPIFGLAGGLLGVGAGAATMAVVKRTESKGARIAAAAFFYGLALVLSIVITTLALQAQDP